MKKIFALAVVTMLFATTAFAAAGDQAGNGDQWNQMYQYCNQMMQSWGPGKAPDQSGGTQPQGQQTSYHGGMMGNGGYGHMMGSGNYGNMMGNGSYGNMMSVVEFQ